MDRLIYTAMSGAKHTMLRQSTISNNLANSQTPGFRSELAAFRALPVLGGALPTRAFVTEQTTGSDFTPAPMMQTGRELDAAIDGDGWFAVQTGSGEAYTRNGSFEIDAAGLLKTRSGAVVLGENGPITIPENTRVTIGPDGTISGVSLDDVTQNNDLGRLKLVNPAVAGLERGSDGLFRQRSGETAPASADVKLAGGMLEGSNVNPVTQLVDMIAAQRQYDTQIQLLQKANENARAAAQVMAFNA
ncbi:flagellar basal-body rod protein FlgF [Jeongeupia naejangsanensis]|uniref:Flagellar basal-body rod protein FlgF n=1 Tax=Jeongeupia naejangsanensis TaxID=613195 RepID=A0ABS2BIH5_9NEIS|nr:flagellar basal-body rod protein FlgF [Jeongeupia naejangsanensis]MBM3115265.1 flagellar basal-body rod protein FlgF [Jeongeupia naejangsanensis]